MCFYVFDNKNILYYVIEIKKGFIVYIFCRKIVVKFLFIMFFFLRKKKFGFYIKLSFVIIWIIILKYMYCLFF